jgi:hypothetical protein
MQEEKEIETEQELASQMFKEENAKLKNAERALVKTLSDTNAVSECADRELVTLRASLVRLKDSHHALEAPLEIAMSLLSTTLIAVNTAVGENSELLERQSRVDKNKERSDSECLKKLEKAKKVKM